MKKPKTTPEAPKASVTQTPKVEPLLLSREDLVALGITYTRNRLWLLVKRGSFPAPIQMPGISVTGSRKFWRRTDVIAWIEAQPGACLGGPKAA